MRTSNSPFLIALFQPLNLAMLGLTAAAGLCSAWWLFPVGFAFWLVMFLSVSLNPSLRMSQRIRQRSQLTQRFQERFKRIERVQLTLHTTLMGQPQAVRQAFRAVQEAVEELVERVYALCSRFSVLENHRLVVQFNNRSPETEMGIVKEKIAATDDPALRKEYTETLRALEEQAVSLRAIANMLDQADAQLASLSTSLEIKLTDVTRLCALGLASVRAETPAMLESIHELSGQLLEYEKEVAAQKI